MKNIIITLFVSCIFCQSSFAAKEQKVKILALNWSSQPVLSHITGLLLQKNGVEVEYIASISTGQDFMLTNNLAHIQIESWSGGLGDKSNHLIEIGKIIDAGNHPVMAREEWWYPLFVKKLCPGLPDWRALNQCAHLFSNQQTSPKGRYILGPWVNRESARIRALNLNFVPIKYNSAQEFFAQLKQAIEKKRPIVMYNWSPNWTDIHIAGEFVEFPTYDPKCEIDPEWGLSKKWLWDCGNPTNFALKKITSLQLPQVSPCAFAIVQAIEFTKQDINEAAYRVDIEGLSHQSAAQLWLDKNSARWQKWLNQPSKCY